MVQIDVPVAFGIGSLFADAAYRQLQTGQALPFYRTLVINNIYQIFFFSWIPVYFMLNYFGWETTHMWWHADSVTAYPFFTPIFIVNADGTGLSVVPGIDKAFEPLAASVVGTGVISQVLRGRHSIRLEHRVID